MMRFVAIACLLAAAAVGVCGAAPELSNEKGSRQPLLVGKLFGRDPNGFSVGMGVGLGAEVDDIEASVDLGPFGFTLDPAPRKERKGGKGEAAPAAPAAPACDRYCDPYTLQVCCNGPTGCVPNGEVVASCAAPGAAGYGTTYAPSYSTGYTYGRKLQEARDALKL